MATRKEEVELPLGSELSNSFEEEDHLLNYKPTIEWEEPPEEFLEDNIPIAPDSNIDETKQRVQGVIDGYNRITQLADAVQKQVDTRVGTLDINLDPAVDAHTIAAIKRRFPTKDPNTLTYNMYRQALQCLQNNAIQAPQVTATDVQGAKNDPTRTNFGGLGNKAGQNRAEVSSAANSMKPLDLQKYQKQATLAMFKLMEDLVSNNSDKRIKKHEKKYKHERGTGPTGP